MDTTRSPQTTHRAAFTVATLGIALPMFASAAPSPLYPVYQHLWGLDAGTITIVFAVYVGALLIGLLTLGALSDHVGRRHVALAAVVVLAASMLLFTLAESAATLITARAVEGIATGAAVNVFSAAAIDTQPSRHAGALATGIVPIIGLGVGIAASALLVQFAPDPRGLVFIITTVALVILAVLAARTLSAHPTQPRPTSLRAVVRLLTPHVHVPHDARRALLTGLPALVAVWSLSGYLLALGTAVIPQRLGITGTAAAGIVLSVFFFAAAASAPLVAGSRHGLGTRPAAALLGIGLLLLTAGAATASVPVYLAGLTIGGVGFVTTYAGVLATLTHVAAERRGSLFAAVYIVSYLAYGLPVVISGLVADRFGLWAATIGYTVFVAAAVAATLLGRRPPLTSQAHQGPSAAIAEPDRVPER